ncbi:MAG: EAL domain-containing protein [Pseudomonadota bacterium]
MKSDDLLRLLVIEESLEEAEFLLSTLRNAGIAPRPSTVEDLDELRGLLDGKPLDMILLNGGVDGLDLNSVANEVTRTGKDVPIIALLDEASDEQDVSALQAGATATAISENHDHLVSVVQRENANLIARRRMRFLEGSLREAEKRAYALLDSSRDAIAYVHEGMHVYANPAYLQLFNYDEFEELAGLPILDMVTSDDAPKLKDVLRALSKNADSPDDLEVVLKMPSGDEKQALMAFSPASIDGEPCTQVVLRDRGEDPELQRELKDLKSQDLVTGLYNRHHLVQAIEEARGRVVKGEDAASLIFIEIDNFKSSLDRVGLAGVDLVLADLADVIRKGVADNGLAARFGDQSFSVLVSGDARKGQALAEVLRKRIEGHISEVSGKSITLTASLGVSPILESSPGASDLLSIASTEAQAAANDGGNQVRVHDPLSHRPGEDSGGHQWLALVEDALANNRISLVFQPVVSLHGDEQQIYEVLFRLTTKDGEEISPGEFIPTIAEHELGRQVDRRVIVLALEKLKDHQTSTGSPVQFFIKLLPNTMSDQTMLPWLAKQMQANRLSGDSVVFEMPESKLMTNLKPAKQFLKGLKQLHCKFAIEQFGSGINSFQILKHIPADYLKIDRTFMTDLPKNEEHQNKVKELAQQAQSQGKVTIAEFVEDAASMSILWQCGVNFVQGNFLQEPMKVMSYEFS